MKTFSFQYKLLPFYVSYLLLTLLVARNSFFWDTIQLGSKHAHFYFEHNLRFVFLPDNIDSGHIPAFGYLLAIVWEIAGKSLFISHLFMLPFLLGIVYQLKKLLEKFFEPSVQYLVLALLLLDPTLLAQSTLITPDIPLFFFMLLLINSILSEKPVLKIAAVTGLALISMRGWMVALLIYLWECYYSYRKIHRGKNFFQWGKSLLSYIPGGSIAISYLLIHYHVKGWIGYHEDSPWAPCFAKVVFVGFLRNLFIYAWRLVDFGRLSVWLTLVLTIRYMIKYFAADRNLRNLILLTAFFIFLFPVSMILRANLLGHRYLLPVYFVFSLLAYYLLFRKMVFSGIKRIMLSAFLIISLLAGNLIIYPDRIAQGWDSSLAYMPYLNLRKEAFRYMLKHDIPFEKTGTVFPNQTSTKYIDLTPDDILFAPKDLIKNQYFFYSNVFNDISDDEYSQLFTSWYKEAEFKKRGIKIILFRNPSP